MPTYEYKCVDCRKRYEKREGFDAPASQTCPKCGGSARRVIHAAGIVFKGAGFYVTDSRKAAPEAASESKAASKPASESKPPPEAASESKAPSEKESKAKSSESAPKAKADESAAAS